MPNWLAHTWIILMIVGGCQMASITEAGALNKNATAPFTYHQIILNGFMFLLIGLYCFWKINEWFGYVIGGLGILLLVGGIVCLLIWSRKNNLTGDS